jgi:hypothetical protein
LKMQAILEDNGYVEGTIHRYLIMAKKSSWYLEGCYEPWVVFILDTVLFALEMMKGFYVSEYDYVSSLPFADLEVLSNKQLANLHISRKKVVFSYYPW